MLLNGLLILETCKRYIKHFSLNKSDEIELCENILIEFISLNVY